LQLVGWGGLAILTVPLKQIVFGSLGAAVLFSAYQLPLALILSALLRRFYHWVRPAGMPFTRGALVVVAASAVAAIIDVSLSLPLNRLFDIPQQSELAVPGLYAFRLAVYAIWSLGYFLVKTLIQARDLEFQAAVTDERHRLEMLRYQLNPNFLAKSLTTIGHEIGENPATARGMTMSLATFYQNTLRHTDRGQTATLGDEIALVRAYLDIEVLRLRGALKVNFDVDESLLTRPLPPIMLLPLAEQAVKVGGTPTVPLIITITAQLSADGLVLLEVANSGSLEKTRASASPFGAPDVCAHLERHYPGHHRFTLRQDSFTTRATIFLPLLG
jgi:two-component system sensor histidine kinase AlgZ